VFRNALQVFRGPAQIGILALVTVGTVSILHWLFRGSLLGDSRSCNETWCALKMSVPCFFADTVLSV